MLRGPRVVLRDWIPEDALPFVQMNADPAVMRYFPKRLSVEKSVEMLTRIRERIEENGWGLWALEVDAQFAGFVGLATPPYETPFTPCVEVGWRLRTEFWGFGYATEAALLSLLYGFEETGMDEIVSFTTKTNERSQRVMRRLGMKSDPIDDFDHPLLEAGDPLLKHCLYRIVNTDENVADLRKRLGSFGTKEI